MKRKRNWPVIWCADWALDDLFSLQLNVYSLIFYCRYILKQLGQTADAELILAHASLQVILFSSLHVMLIQYVLWFVVFSGRGFHRDGSLRGRAPFAIILSADNLLC